MGPTGPRYGSVATDGGGPNVWTSMGNLYAVDGATALGGMPGGGDSTNPLFISGFGFNLPTTAVIDGIKMEYLRSGVNAAAASIKLTKTAGVVATPEHADYSLDGYPSVLTWFTYGSSTDMWGATWTPAEINASGFGVEITAYNTHGGGQANIDAVRLTVYWHTGPADVPKRYLYKVFNSAGTYLGALPSVISDFEYTQDINTGGVQITIECAVAIDTARQAPDTLTDEAGNTITSEALANLTTEGAIPLMAPGNVTYNAVIKNGNFLQVFEYSYYWPNGKCMFLGQMERWESSAGDDQGGAETTKILAYSDGQDLDNYLIRGNPYTYTGDVTQASQNASATVVQNPAGYAGWDRFGQTWKVGAGVTNVGAISLLLVGTANVTVSMYDNSGASTLLGVSSQFVSVAGATEIQFAFPTSIPVTAGNTYFFAVSLDDGQTITIYYQNTDVYANGAMYESSYSGGGGGSYGILTGDLYFKTFSGTGSTIGTFTSMDPTTGMLKTFMDDYIARGGMITYTASSLQATGLSLTYGFNTNTIYEGVKAVESMAPSGFYYYVDIGTDIINVKRSNTVADIVLTKGRHIGKMRLVATIEGVKNVVNFTGGPTAGVNLYKQYQDVSSVRRYLPRLERVTDNRVTVGATADAIGGSAVADKKDEAYQSTVTILDRTMDTTLVKPGLVIGFNGYGTFVDQILAQIVSVNYTPGAVHCVLGIIPKRMTPAFDKITRGLIAQQTIANPATPS